VSSHCLPDADIDWAEALSTFKVNMAADKEYRARREAERAAEEAVEVEKVTVIEPRSLVDVAELPRNSKALALRALEAGWTVQAGKSRTHKEATLYVSDSEEGAKKPYRAGDVRYPAEDRTHFVLNAHLAEQVAFRLYYTTRANGLTSFIVGDCKDPISGRMSIFDGPTVKAFSAEADLTSVMTPDDFADWFDTLVPPAKPRAPRKPRATKNERTAAAMLAGEEWK
jgi:hypothetical protein